ncbi:MAG: RHS repeat protein [Anaerolineales bacterium]|nr:RHS repeat protein [Anaerolineales bacterium]
MRSVRSYNPVGTTGTWTVEGEVVLTHDVLGNLVQVHQPTGHTTTMSYDMAGRKLSMTDPDLGTWHYTYTRRGQLKDQTDACANLTALTYDALDRLRVQTVTAGNNANCRTTPAAGASVNYTYTYDVGQAALGQLTGVRASDGSYTKNLLYDADGRVRAEGIAIFGSINYTTSYTYDAYQRLVVTTYPGGEKVRVGYNSMGLPETLTSTAVISPLVSGCRLRCRGTTGDVEPRGRLAAADTAVWAVEHQWGAGWAVARHHGDAGQQCGHGAGLHLRCLWQRADPPRAWWNASRLQL